MRILIFALLVVAAVSQAYAQTVTYTCGAMTSKGQPCKIRVKTVGAKCHHHNSGIASMDIAESHFCGAKTQKGTPCRRRVAIIGQRCFSHKEQ